MTSDADSNLKEASKKLTVGLDKVKAQLKSKARSGKILAILQDNPCRLKSKHLIQYGTDENNIDTFYSGKHEWIKKKIIDAIIDEFGDLVTVSSEKDVPYGKLDIEIQFDNMRIILEYGRKRIAIEIKTGHLVKSDHFFQIDRYLIDVDILIRIRVDTEDVAVINNTYIKDAIINDLTRWSRKHPSFI